MATLIDELPLCGLRKSDLYNLRQIFYDSIREGSYYGRKDYWDKSMDRLGEWMNAIELIAEDNSIKLKDNK